MRALVLAAVAALLPATFAIAESAAPAGLSITAAWARATPGGATTGAAYVTITAPASAGDTLLSAETPSADRTELHEHIHEGDVMKMRRVDAAEIKPGGALEMAPMSYHLMLIGLKSPLKAGDTVHLSLTFKSAGKMDVDVPVKPIGASGPSDVMPAHDHMH